MEKSDLKTGYVIETRAKQRGVVMLGTTNGDIIAGNREETDFEKIWYPLDSYEDDLTHGSNEDYDIVKVYEFSSNQTGASIKDVGSLIWERKEVKEYTMEELQKLVGHEFKIKK